MGRCKTCKFWQRCYDYGLEDRGVCQNARVLGCLGDEPDGIYEWEAAEVNCGPEFGCVHHEYTLPVLSGLVGIFNRVTTGYNVPFKPVQV